MAEQTKSTKYSGTTEKRKADEQTTGDTPKRTKAYEMPTQPANLPLHGIAAGGEHSQDALAAAEKDLQPFGTVDWENYLQYRPEYPVSLRYQISKHHGTQNDGAFRLAHDVGSGSGIYAKELATMFDHVVVSDPSAENLAQAGKNLSEVFRTTRHTAVSGRPCTFSFAQCGGEDAHLRTAANSVDVMTVMEAAHWMDAEKLMDSAAQSLKRNGTLAIVMYGPRVFIKDSSRANDALGLVMRRVMENVVSKPTEDEELRSRFNRAVQHTRVGLDFIPFNDDKWCLARSRRVRINGRGKGRYPHDILNPFDDEKGETPPGSRVRDHEVYLHFDQGEGDPEAVGWRKKVSKTWFRPYAATINPQSPAETMEMEELGLLEKILAEEFPDDDREIVVEWVVDIVLATKK
jgi:SAM-dependent methyltransferase